MCTVYDARSATAMRLWDHSTVVPVRQLPGYPADRGLATIHFRVRVGPTCRQVRGSGYPGHRGFTCAQGDKAKTLITRALPSGRNLFFLDTSPSERYTPRLIYVFETK